MIYFHDAFIYALYFTNNSLVLQSFLLRIEVRPRDCRLLSSWLPVSRITSTRVISDTAKIPVSRDPNMGKKSLNAQLWHYDLVTAEKYRFATYGSIETN